MSRFSLQRKSSRVLSDILVSTGNRQLDIQRGLLAWLGSWHLFTRQGNGK